MQFEYSLREFIRGVTGPFWFQWGSMNLNSLDIRDSPRFFLQPTIANILRSSSLHLSLSHSQLIPFCLSQKATNGLNGPCTSERNLSLCKRSSSWWINEIPKFTSSTATPSESPQHTNRAVAHYFPALKDFLEEGYSRSSIGVSTRHNGSDSAHQSYGRGSRWS